MQTFNISGSSWLSQGSESASCFAVNWCQGQVLKWCTELILFLGLEDLRKAQCQGKRFWLLDASPKCQKSETFHCSQGRNCMTCSQSVSCNQGNRFQSVFLRSAYGLIIRFPLALRGLHLYFDERWCLLVSTSVILICLRFQLLQPNTDGT